MKIEKLKESFYPGTVSSFWLETESRDRDRIVYKSDKYQMYLTFDFDEMIVSLGTDKDDDLIKSRMNFLYDKKLLTQFISAVDLILEDCIDDFINRITLSDILFGDPSRKITNKKALQNVKALFNREVSRYLMNG